VQRSPVILYLAQIMLLTSSVDLIWGIVMLDECVKPLNNNDKSMFTLAISSSSDQFVDELVRQLDEGELPPEGKSSEQEVNIIG